VWLFKLNNFALQNIGAAAEYNAVNINWGNQKIMSSEPMQHPGYNIEMKCLSWPLQSWFILFVMNWPLNA